MPALASEEGMAVCLTSQTHPAACRVFALAARSAKLILQLCCRPHCLAQVCIAGRGATCPLTIGRTPTSLPRLGTTKASLMVNNRFICDGFLKSITYFRGSPDGTVFISIWRQVGDQTFLLRHRIQLKRDPIGIHTKELEEPLAVERGDFLGVHYSRTTPTGVLVSAIPDDSVVPIEDLFQTYSVDAYDEELVVGSAMDLSRFSMGLERRTFAIQGRIVYNVGDSSSNIRGKPLAGVYT